MSEPTIGSSLPLHGGYMVSRPPAPRISAGGMAMPNDAVSLSRNDPTEANWPATIAQAARTDLTQAAVDLVARNMSSLTWDWVLSIVPEGEEEPDAALEALVRLLGSLAPEVEGHSDRVGAMATRLVGTLLQESGQDPQSAGNLADAARYRNVGMLAVELSCLDDGERQELALQAREALGKARMAGRLHDLGKLAVPRGILNKPGPLTAVERRIVEFHPLVGERMLERVPGMAAIREPVRWHHERWDGGGYPDGLLEGETPLAARVLCVVDSYDAMTEERPYRERLTPQQALQEILACSGTHFDPHVAGTFARMLVERL